MCFDFAFSKGFPSPGRLLLHLTKTQFTLSFLQKVISFSFFYFGVCHVTYRTLVPWPGIKPVPHAFGTWNPNHRTAREIPESHSLNLTPTPNTHSTKVVSSSSKLPKRPCISLTQHLSQCCNHRFTSLSPPPVSNLRAYQGLWVAMTGYGLLCWLSSRESACSAGDTQVWSLGGEDPLEEEMATHCSILAWEIPWRDFHGKSLAGYSPWGLKESDITEHSFILYRIISYHGLYLLSH